MKYETVHSFGCQGDYVVYRAGHRKISSQVNTALGVAFAGIWFKLLVKYDVSY